VRVAKAAEPFRIETLTREHDRNGFDCGEPTLNTYLQRLALQHAERNISRTFVALQGESFSILGFYTLVNGRVDFASVPTDKKLPPNVPVPTVLLGRLAVHVGGQGTGIERYLLLHALWRATRIADEAGVYAVEVDALNDSAARFYTRYGFVPLLDAPLHLYLPMRTIRQLGLDFTD
jgi:GNAT superfamily N-acetyltransferase